MRNNLIFATKIKYDARKREREREKMNRTEEDEDRQMNERIVHDKFSVE